MKTLTLILISSIALAADEAPRRGLVTCPSGQTCTDEDSKVMAKAASPKTPVIPPEIRAAFWRAAAEYNAIAPKFEQAKSALDAARAALCPEGLQAVADAKGEPACEVKSTTSVRPDNSK